MKQRTGGVYTGEDAHDGVGFVRDPVRREEQKENEKKAPTRGKTNDTGESKQKKTSP